MLSVCAFIVFLACLEADLESCKRPITYVDRVEYRVPLEYRHTIVKRVVHKRCRCCEGN